MNIRVFTAALLASTAFTGAALAQTAPDAPKPAQAGKPAPKPAAGAAAAPAPAPAAPARSRSLTEPGLTASPTDFGTVVAGGSGQGPAATPGGVNRQELGGGYMIEEDATKSRSTVTRDAIDKQSPSANPYQLINLLPGVIQSSTDNTGLNGGNIRLRGFNSDHVGLTIEGMPVNDSGNYALFPQEYLDAENISQISIAQGAPDLDSPHIGSAGGVINIYMRDPAKTFGGMVDFTAGSHGLFREFARLDSGQIGNIRASASYSHMYADHWAGPGQNKRDNFELKTVWDPSPSATIRFSLLFNHAINNFYANPNKAQFNTAGYQPVFLDALPSTFSKQTSPIDQSANSASNYYKFRVNPFNNLIMSAPSNFSITPNLTFDTIPYFWYGFGNGGGVTTMSESGMFWGNLKVTGVNYGGTAALTDKILYYNPSITETYRPGIINKLSYTLGDHKIVGGWWFEDAYHRQTGPFAPLNADGSVSDPFARGSNFSLPATAVCTINVTGTNGVKGTVVPCPGGAMQKRDQLTTTITNMFFLGDTWSINDKWTLDAGVKQVFVNRTVKDYMPGSIPSASLHDTATLPTIGLRFKPNEENQFWTSLATTFRSAPNFTLTQSFSSTTGVVTPISVPPPEYGVMFEAGHRYQGQTFATSVSGFIGRFRNYQLSTNIPDPAGSGSTVNVTLNAGDLLTYGVNAELGTRPYENFRPYISGEILKTEILGNMPQSGKLAGVTINDFLPTKGKQLPGAPNFSAGFGLDYDNGHLFGNLAYKYQGKQFSSFMNDENMPGFGRVDFGIGYRFSDIGSIKAPEIKLNLANLFNTRQLTGVNGITTNALATTGVKGSTISGSAPTYYLGEGFSATLTARASF